MSQAKITGDPEALITIRYSKYLEMKKFSNAAMNETRTRKKPLTMKPKTKQDTKNTRPTAEISNTKAKQYKSCEFVSSDENDTDSVTEKKKKENMAKKFKVVSGSTPGRSSITFEVNASNPSFNEPTTNQENITSRQQQNIGDTTMSSAGCVADIVDSKSVASTTNPSVLSLKIDRISKATTGNETEDIADIVRVGKQDVGTNTEAADNQQVKGKRKKKKNNPTIGNNDVKRFHFDQKIMDGNSFDKHVRCFLNKIPEYHHGSYSVRERYENITCYLLKRHLEDAIFRTQKDCNRKFFTTH
ncbi:unnamed protein product [Rotaria socialis]|uniref:Uncharacterized protein n=1 Tax=Rotaria socialis TaxID=392032 RepID=A0A821BVK1_9BILA|nr:unnamed protein product [Rotaria socialis]CAF4593282.1 unnamed protein product [Rotaria socialis]CAF4902818.1 unnamed protein product [Rotaria socialis]